MKQYLLDTNICVFILRNKYNVASYILKAGIDNCHISIITYAELYYGAMNSNNVDRNLEQLEEFADGIDILPIDDIIPCFAKEKAVLRKKGTPIDDFDLLIGTTALSHNMVVVTENIKHLGKIEGLEIENWVER